MSQSFTFIDVAGNQAQYTVFDRDRDDNFHWSTDHGDQGFATSFEQARYRARTVLKDSMAAKRRSEEKTTMASFPLPWRLLNMPIGTTVIQGSSVRPPNRSHGPKGTSFRPRQRTGASN